MSSDLPRIVTKRELCQIVPYSPQHIGRLEKRKKFPERIEIGPGRVGWLLSEVEAWLMEQRQTRGRVRKPDPSVRGRAQCQSSSRS